MSAIDYAARGWPVIPLHTPTSYGTKTGIDRATCSCGKATCENQGKHPRTGNGLLDATIDADVIARWWRRWPDANVGITTGVAFDVLDLDGMEALDALDTAGAGHPPVLGPMVVTGRGIHIYVEPVGAKNRAALLPNVDWRGTGGYVVAPPSIHMSGDVYRWGELHTIDEPLRRCPPWLAELVCGPKPRGVASATPAARGGGGVTRYGQRALESEVARLALAAEGTRNDELNQAAFSLAQLVATGDLPADEVARALLTVALRIGLTEPEAITTIRSGMNGGMSKPRGTEAQR